MNDDKWRPGESWEQYWRRVTWKSAFDQFAPKDGESREPVFHVGCATLTIAGFASIVGWLFAPLVFGTSQASIWTALVASLAVMAVLGYRAAHPRSAGRRTPPFRSDKLVWLSVLGSGAYMAGFGATSLLEFENQTLTESLTLGAVGLILGLVVGAVLHGLRRLVRV